ncbi:MAG: acyl-CoA dehydrogenase [Myxococcota bacterium]|nr:acyl-CoA dehydrogenase [Myxococcota bacterium]
MMQLIRLRDFEFLLHDVLEVEQLCDSPNFGQHSRAVFDAILETAKKLAEEKYENHAAHIDTNPPRLIDGELVLPEAIKVATDAYAENGFAAAPFPEEWGGMGLPLTVSNTYQLFFNAANISTSTYIGLTMAAANMLLAHGDEALKERYLRDMVAGRFFGTMCLSEPHAGSSLANLRTTATPNGDGTYQIRGTKMWITGADHELSENIIHFVLARLPDAKVGTRGISLFVVPKYVVDEAGQNGQRNDVRLVGLNHKMGYRGSVNGILEFGESGPCTGYLVGMPHAGLRYMFHMMNEARVGTGVASVACAYAGLRHAVAYAKERPQGFKPGQNDQSEPEVMIVEHADVKRMLLAQKAYVEGGAHLTLYCSYLMDQHAIAQSANDESANELDLLLALLTPIAKGWSSEYCIHANSLAIQVLGGCGYTHDYPVERLYRDNRLNSIVEGTTGIQALDLLGRKVTMANGAALMVLMARMQATMMEASQHDALVNYVEQLRAVSQRLGQTTMALSQVAIRGEYERFLANATPFLHALGHTVVAWLWLVQGIVITRQLEQKPSDAYLLGKRQTMQYFFQWELPKVDGWLGVLEPVDTTCLDMHPDWF